VSLWTQGVAWCLGLLACLAAMVWQVGQWDQDFATFQFLLLIVAPIIWMIERRRSNVEASPSSQTAENSYAAWLAILVGLTSLLTCILVGFGMEDLPPAYHDEYSYLFQAKTLLRGAFSVPSHPTHPELFDQMHVLNEGRMASRYYPGTGLWLAPFVALGHPYWGHWLASAIASYFVFWTGFELGKLRVAAVSGISCALSPGIALFGNLLLAHQPTLASLCVFIWAFVKWQRTRDLQDALIAGCGLSYAMLCRPMTAAGIGLPFGIVFLYWLVFGRDNDRPLTLLRRFRALIALGLPLILGWSVMLAYHKEVTGNWRTSPYQLYTDLYTPRHIYGFNNVLRGEQKLGPKVIDAYDRWAENLTPELALENAFNRWLCSWIWTFDLLPILLSTVVVVGTIHRVDRRWITIGFSIVSLHLVHIPYWYHGIMGWHYVFETAPLWCLCLGLATDLLFESWRISGRWVMPIWWSFLLMTSLAGDYFPFDKTSLPIKDLPRISSGASSIYFPRSQYAKFDRWLNASVKNRPALILIEVDPSEKDVDYITNSPLLNDVILRARYRPGITDVNEIVNAFPDRTILICNPRRETLQLVAQPDSPR
jgi:hypothetical protein